MAGKTQQQATKNKPASKAKPQQPSIKPVAGANTETATGTNTVSAQTNTDGATGTITASAETGTGTTANTNTAPAQSNTETATDSSTDAAAGSNATSAQTGTGTTADTNTAPAQTSTDSKEDNSLWSPSAVDVLVLGIRRAMELKARLDAEKSVADAEAGLILKDAIDEVAQIAGI